MRYLHCFYDMAVSPCSYDFFTFFMSCEITRVRRNLDALYLHIVKGINGDFRHDNLRTEAQNIVFFENVIIPGLSLLPSCTKFQWVDREELNVEALSNEQIFPRGYQTRRPIPDYIGNDLTLSRVIGDPSQSFKAPQYSNNFVDQWLTRINGKPFITLTMRELERDDHNGTRKANTETWEIIFQNVIENGIQPIVIRDTDLAFSAKPIFQNAIECPEASLSVTFRLAMYQKSLCNFVKANGPCILNYFCDNNSAIFIETDPDVTAITEDWFRHKYGMVKNSSFPMTKKKMRFIWGSENEQIVEQIIKNINQPKNNELNDFYNIEHISTSFSVACNKFLQNLSLGGILQEDINFLSALKSVDEKFSQIDVPDILGIIKSRESETFRPGLSDELRKFQNA